LQGKSDPSDRVDTFDLMVSIKRAARALDVPERNLYERAREGRITVERRDSGRARTLVDLDVCRAEVKALRCQAPGCDKPAYRAGRFCSHPCSVRKYAPEIRECKWCGEPFPVEGHRTRDRGGVGQQFCKPKCSARWRSKYAPETFQREGEAVTCPICGETRYRPPSHQHHKCCSDACAHEAFRRWLATPEGSKAHQRSLVNAHAAVLAPSLALLKEGIVPVKIAGSLLYCDPENVGAHLPVERRQFGRMRRRGVNARELLAVSPHPHARRRLSKPLAMLNGTPTVGRPRELTKAELVLVIELRAADPAKWGWRTLAAKVNEGRAPEKAVSHMAVKRAFERVTAPAVAL
jgi:hypothetical protein